MNKTQAREIMVEELEEEFPEAVMYHFPLNKDGMAQLDHVDLDWDVVIDFLVSKGWRKR